MYLFTKICVGLLTLNELNYKIYILTRLKVCLVAATRAGKNYVHLCSLNQTEFLFIIQISLFEGHIKRLKTAIDVVSTSSMLKPFSSWMLASIFRQMMKNIYNNEK